MIPIEQFAQAALSGDSLLLRSMTQDLVINSANVRLADTPKPKTNNPRLLATSAALLELFAMRLNQEPPAWTSTVVPLTEPIYLVKAAATMRHLRELCETQAPEPLRKRHLYAPPNYLEFA